MSGKSIVPGEAVAALARIRLDAGVNLSMTLQVVLADETFGAVDASVLAVSKMSLDMRADILLAAEELATLRILALPFTTMSLVRLFDIRLHVFCLDTSRLDIAFPLAEGI
jgi:hypothetical protein